METTWCTWAQPYSFFGTLRIVVVVNASGMCNVLAPRFLGQRGVQKGSLALHRVPALRGIYKNGGPRFWTKLLAVINNKNCTKEKNMYIYVELYVLNCIRWGINTLYNTCV